MSCSAKSLSLHLVRKETRHRNHSGPSCNILVRVHSQQIANQPCVWHVSWPHEATNHCWGLRRETTSHANNFLINDTTDGETIEHVTKVLPRFHVVATLALVWRVKATGGLQAAGVSHDSPRTPNVHISGPHPGLTRSGPKSVWA